MAYHLGNLSAKKREAARQFLAAGHFREAMTILSGAVYGAGYDPDYFELFGTALLGCGEIENAGRFLFLSGQRRPDYEMPITIFIDRNHDPHNFRQLHSHFPQRVRDIWRLTKFPDIVHRDLQALGFPEDIQQFYTAQRDARRARRNAKNQKA